MTESGEVIVSSNQTESGKAQASVPATADNKTATFNNETISETALHAYNVTLVLNFPNSADRIVKLPPPQRKHCFELLTKKPLILCMFDLFGISRLTYESYHNICSIHNLEFHPPDVVKTLRSCFATADDLFSRGYCFSQYEFSFSNLQPDSVLSVLYEIVEYLSVVPHSPRLDVILPFNAASVEKLESLDLMLRKNKTNLSLESRISSGLSLFTNLISNTLPDLAPLYSLIENGGICLLEHEWHFLPYWLNFIIPTLITNLSISMPGRKITHRSLAKFSIGHFISSFDNDASNVVILSGLELHSLSGIFAVIQFLIQRSVHSVILLHSHLVDPATLSSSYLLKHWTGLNERKLCISIPSSQLATAKDLSTSRPYILSQAFLKRLYGFSVDIADAHHLISTLDLDCRLGFLNWDKRTETLVSIQLACFEKFSQTSSRTFAFLTEFSSELKDPAFQANPNLCWLPNMLCSLRVDPLQAAYRLNPTESDSSLGQSQKLYTLHTTDPDSACVGTNYQQEELNSLSFTAADCLTIPVDTIVYFCAMDSFDLTVNRVLKLLSMANSQLIIISTPSQLDRFKALISAES